MMISGSPIDPDKPRNASDVSCMKAERIGGEKRGGK